MRKRTKKTDALQGTLDLLILTTLRRGALHGYAIANQIHAISDDDLRVEEGSLYPALHRMEHMGCINARWVVNDNNRRVREYRLTAAGRKRLAEEHDKWTRLSKAVSKILRFA